MIDLVTHKTLYILKYKPFTYLLALFMAFYLAEIYPQSSTSLPTILGLIFQNQILRIILLIIIIFVAQYNYYLASIITIIIVTSYMLSGEWDNIPIEGFKGTTPSLENIKNIKNVKTVKDDTDDKPRNKPEPIYNKNNNDDDESEDFIDLDDTIQDREELKEKLDKISKKKLDNKDVQSINKCINLVTSLPSDKDDTFKELLQNIAAQRKAYIDMCKGKTKEDDVNKAKLQYRKMCKRIVEDFLDDIDDSDVEDEEDK